MSNGVQWEYRGTWKKDKAPLKSDDKKDGVKLEQTLGKKETYLNVGYFFAKALKLGISYKQLEYMSFFKVMAIIKGSIGAQAEENYEMLHIIGNPSLLETKKGAKEYPKLFQEYKKRMEKNGIREVTETANLDALIRMRREQREVKNG